MKTKILITAAIMIFGLVLQPSISNAATEIESTSFKSAMSKTIKYPAFASENGLEGTIWVNLNVLEDGTIQVNATNYSCCKEFRDQVYTQLDG
ncbi:MAG: hypothetical protein GQ527_10440, partial [Bacteroidales bacterium]|nr:hypothetical protein [Bacteroidales bacterium]